MTPRLFLVDDNPERLELLAGQLSAHYMVSSYGSATEALRELEAATTDVLLLVLTAPIVDHRGLVTMIDRVLGSPSPPGNPTGCV